jgi:predicted nucleic acid-binding Zn ribbon protein
LFVIALSKHKGCVLEDTSSVDRCVPILMKRKQKQKFFKSNIMNLVEVLIMVGCLAYIAYIIYLGSKTMNDE